jgi:hypothetical protein
MDRGDRFVSSNRIFEYLPVLPPGLPDRPEQTKQDFFLV